MGRRPDILVHGALTIYNGIRYDFTADQLDYVNRMYFVDPIELENQFLARDATSRPMKVLYISTYAGWAQPPYYQTLYNERAFGYIQNVRAMNSALRFPNTEWLATLCVFTNTTAMINSENPSADAGDYAAQQFQTVFIRTLALAGVPPAYVASAVVHATLLRAQLGYETIFDASGPYSATTPGLYALFNTSGLYFSTAYRSVSYNGFGINITQHTPPSTGSPSVHKRSERIVEGVFTGSLVASRLKAKAMA